MSAINWQELEAIARKALAKNSAEIEHSKRGTPAGKQTRQRKRSKGKRFGAGYGRAS